MIWSPSTSRRCASTARQRSASPSWAMPRSAPCASTAAWSCSRWVEPKPSLMFRPSGSAPMTTTSAPARRKTSGDDLAGGAVGAVDHHLQPVQPVRQRPQQVLDVAVGRRRQVVTRPTSAPIGRGPASRRIAASMRVLDLVGELVPAAGEELDAVVRHRVVRGGEHHAEVGAGVGDQVGDGRGGQHAGVVARRRRRWPGPPRRRRRGTRPRPAGRGRRRPRGGGPRRRPPRRARGPPRPRRSGPARR